MESGKTKMKVIRDTALTGAPGGTFREKRRNKVVMIGYSIKPPWLFVIDCPWVSILYPGGIYRLTFGFAY